MKQRQGRPYREASGFTLTELAVVVAIVALILGGVVLTVGAVNSAREVEQTQQRLEQARNAIIGFAIWAERLPCPAAGGATGVEAFVNPGPVLPVDLSCAAPLNGFVPALTLGIGPTDAQGYLTDAWGNRIRYTVTQWRSDMINPASPANCPPVGLPSPPNNAGPLDYTKCPAFTTAGAMKALGLATIPANAVSMLQVCDSTACGLTLLAPAVVFSVGKNGASAPVGTDELENTDGDAIFVSRTPTPFEPTPAAGFDDLVIWVSPNILYNRLIAAGAI